MGRREPRWRPCHLPFPLTIEPAKSATQGIVALSTRSSDPRERLGRVGGMVPAASVVDTLPGPLPRLPPAPSAPGPSPPKFMPQAACRQPPPHLSAPARRALLLTPRPVPSSLCLVLPVPGTPRPSSTSPAHRSRPFFISNLREAPVFCESLPYSFRL